MAWRTLLIERTKLHPVIGPMREYAYQNPLASYNDGQKGGYIRQVGRDMAVGLSLNK